jgi:hypothetical protein
MSVKSCLIGPLEAESLDDRRVCAVLRPSARLPRVMGRRVFARRRVSGRCRAFWFVAFAGLVCRDRLLRGDGTDAGRGSV